MEAVTLFLATARKREGAPDDVREHNAIIDILSRDIRDYTAAVFESELRPEQYDLAASLIEEADFSASLGEMLHQVSRRVERHVFHPAARAMVDQVLDSIEDAMKAITYDDANAAPVAVDNEARMAELLFLRNRCLTETAIPADQRGALLALLGSAERAYLLIERIDAEHRSVERARYAEARTEREPRQARPAIIPPGALPAE